MGFRGLAALAFRFYSNLVAYVDFYSSKGGFLNSTSTNCVKRLTKHLRVTHNAWRSQFKLSFSV